MTAPRPRQAPGHVVVPQDEPTPYEREQARLSAFAHRLETVLMTIATTTIAIGLATVALAQLSRWWAS